MFSRVYAAALLAHILCGASIFCGAFLLDGKTCVGKCGQHYDHSLVCQCNTQCTSHGNCCPDYNSLCMGGHCTSSFTDVTEALWHNDVNRLDVSMYRTNFQSHVNSTTQSDRSSAPFFTWVDSAALSSRPTFQTFLALQDNYQPVSGLQDLPSSDEAAEVENFLDAVLATPVFRIVLQYLQCQKTVSDQAGLRAELKRLWFTPYPRHPGGVRDSSGFEHVMVGEYKNSATVNGLHHWLAYYSKEKAHHINYYGYVVRKSPDLVALAYDWNGRHKNLSAFFVGTSPEFDMALYTLCALTQEHRVRLSGHSISIQAYDVDYVSGLQVATAFPSL